MKASNLIRSIGVTSTLLTASGPALAHEGDHAEGVLLTVQHMLSSPDHLAMLLAAVAAAVVLRYVMVRRGRRSNIR